MMNPYLFSDTPERRHRVNRQPGSDRVQVDDQAFEVQPDGDGRYRVSLDGQAQRVHAAVHGDSVHVQWRGRSWRIDRIDPTRASAAAGSSAAGACHAPMPGVVVSLHAALGQRVAEGDALLVIESMKLQMTLAAACSGTVSELPLGTGQTFQRGAVLARVAPDEVPT